MLLVLLWQEPSSGMLFLTVAGDGLRSALWLVESPRGLPKRRATLASGPRSGARRWWDRGLIGPGYAEQAGCQPTPFLPAGP